MAAAETSKKGKKRGKKQKRAIEAALMRHPNAGVRLSEQQGSNLSANQEGGRAKKQKRASKAKCIEQEESNVPPVEIPNESRAQMSNPSNDTQGTTKTRGPTRCSALPVESGNRLEVELNEKRQPIGGNSVHLSTYVGCLTREMVPITFGDWRHVPNESKEYYWQAVKQKFTFKEEDEEDAKTYVLQKMGSLARSNKAKLGSDLKKKPDYINKSDWEVFVKMRTTKTWKEKSQVFKDMKKKQTMPYRGSRKGFARITYEILKKEGPIPPEKVRLSAWLHGYTNEKGEAENTEDNELIKKAKEALQAPLSEGSPQSGVKGDALSQVLKQPERRGRLRGAGAGASTSKSVAHAKYSAKIIGLQNTVETMKGKIESLSTLVEKQAKLINTLTRNQKCDQQEDNDDEVNMDESKNSQSKASMQGQIDSISKMVEMQTNLLNVLMNKQGHHQQKQMEVLENDQQEHNDENDNEGSSDGEESNNEESDEESDEENEESDDEMNEVTKEVNLRSNAKNVKSNETPCTTPQSHNGNNSRLSSKGKFKLFNWKKPKELVAMGKWSTDDPKEVVHGKPLGEGVSKVWIEIVYQPKAPLFRPCFGNDVIEDLQGSTAAWPTKNIVMFD